jgi:hypothetical protein
MPRWPSAACPCFPGSSRRRRAVFPAKPASRCHADRQLIRRRSPGQAGGRGQGRLVGSKPALARSAALRHALGTGCDGGEAAHTAAPPDPARSPASGLCGFAPTRRWPGWCVCVLLTPAFALGASSRSSNNCRQCPDELARTCPRRRAAGCLLASAPPATRRRTSWLSLPWTERFIGSIPGALAGRLDSTAPATNRRAAFGGVIRAGPLGPARDRH